MKDPHIREILRQTLLQPYINDRDSKVVEEMKLPLAKARIDMAVINGHLHAYEIKSASDNLLRLGGQIDGYQKIFDYVTVVIENKHYGKVYEYLPTWVGLCICSDTGGEGRITYIREPSLNKSQSPFHLAQLLWHDELVELLIDQNIPHKKNDRNWILCKTIINNIPLETLTRLVREKLKARTDWQV